MPPPQDSTLCATDYAHPWDRLVAQFKFNGALDLAPSLAGGLELAWMAAGRPLPGVLLPVPLSPARLRERGFNQAWEIARRLARRLRCDADPNALRRTRHTPQQSALRIERRASNVKDAFAVDPACVAALRGRTVTIVDDVMTTGATAAELARTLREAGAASVNVWVFARTPSPDE